MWSSSPSNNEAGTPHADSSPADRPQAGRPDAGRPEADSSQADTIVALSTPPGFGAVAIVRLSGPKALFIGRTLAPSVGPWRARYATRITIADGAGAVIDDALALAFPAPRSYTGEDVLELHVHGSPAVAREVLIAAVAAGARLALPGEFTRRAFLNGKMDLAAAEAVGDLIAAEHRSAARAARARLSGGLDAYVRDLAGRIDTALQALAASLDYPDEVEPPEPGAFARELAAIEGALAELTQGFERGRLVREGVAVAIAGPPNAGKSSLLNALLGHDRALVSSIAGTTRDTIEETLALGSLVARITDTAGLRATQDALEAAGIARSRNTVDAARIVLVVVEAPAVGVEAQAVLELTRERRRVVLFNKSDLGRDGFDARGPAETDAILGSAHDGVTVDRVRLRLRELAESDDMPDLERPALGTARQAAAVLAAREALGFALETLGAGDALDLTAMPLATAAARLRELSGRDASEALLDGIFSRFCVGK